MRLTVGYIAAGYEGRRDVLGNLRTECTDCNEGFRDIALPKPNRIKLFGQIRRATIDDQRAVLEWLQRKFQGPS